MRSISRSGHSLESRLRIKENLRFLIRKAGISVTALGRKTATSRKTLYNWECGATPADLASVKRVAAFFELTVDEICFTDLTVDQATPALGRPSIELDHSAMSARYEVTVRKIL